MMQNDHVVNDTFNVLGDNGEQVMNNLAVMTRKPIKVDVVRIEEVFHNTCLYRSRFNSVIKDYLYIPQKRVIA